MGESGSLTISKPFISDKPAVVQKNVSSDSHNGDKEEEEGNRLGTKTFSQHSNILS